MSKIEFVEMTLKVHADTEKAVLVSDDGEAEKAVWLPKSQIEIYPLKDGNIMVVLPQWLAADKGLI